MADSMTQRQALRVLLIDDNPDDRALVARVLRRMHADVQVEHVTRARDLTQALDTAAFDIVITDFQLRWTDGLAVLRRVKKRHPACPVVMFTGTGTEQVAVEAMREGLDDYIIKTPEHFSRLPAAIERALQRLAQREELRLARQRFQTAFDAAPSGIAVLDARGVVLEVNDAWCTMFAYPRDELLGMTFRALIHPEELDALREFDARFCSGETEGVQAERRFIRTEGTAWWAQLSVSVVRGENDDLSYFIAQTIDVTAKRETDAAQRALEERLRQTQKLESLGVMAAGVAHDFNNLLSTVLGNAELLWKELAYGSRAHDRARQIDTAARHGAALTRQMLAYSGGGRFVVNPIRLSEVVDQITALLDIAASGALAVRHDLGDDAPCIEADESQIRQLAINLVTNAAEAFGEAGGRVDNRTGTIDLAATHRLDGDQGEALRPGRHAYVEVTDTGAGIQPDILSRIFEPFFTTKFQGRGLGLSAALGIARGHRGGIVVSTAVGQGTIVRVLLPCSSSLGTHETPECPGATAPDRATTILVVEDEEMVRNVVTAALERSGFTVVLAANGRKALELIDASTHHVSLVLLDQAMPMMSGTEVIRELRHHRPDLPIILTSGHLPVRAMKGLAAGAVDAFLQKPFNASQLVALVRRIVGDKVRSPANTRAASSSVEHARP